MAEPDELEDRVVATLRGEGLIAPAASRAWIGRAATGVVAVALLVLGPVFVRPETAAPAGDLYLLALYSGRSYAEAAPGVRAAEYGRWARGRGKAVVDGAELSGRPAVLGPPPGPDADMSGYFIVRAASDGEALAVARTVPHLRHGGTIVVHRTGR